MHIRRGRKWPRRIATYLLVMTAGPVLVGASISITTWLIGESLGTVIPSRTLGRTVFRALPFLFATAGLSLLYKAVPARQVPVLPAAIGGIRPAERFEVELEDPVLGRTLRHAYAVDALPVAG